MDYKELWKIALEWLIVIVGLALLAILWVYTRWIVVVITLVVLFFAYMLVEIYREGRDLSS